MALSLILLSLLGTVAHATGLVDDTINAENLYSKYPLSNYQLDFYVDNSWSWLPWNWLDGIGKSVQYGLYCITNFVWTISLYLSNATGYVVQEAYKLDFINDMADSIGKSIQTLAGVTQNGFSSTGFYIGFLLLIILVVGLYVAYTGLIKRETSKALHAVINFVVVFVLSASFIAYAPDYIKKINEFSSDISTASLDLGTKIMLPNSDSEGKDSVDLIRGSLFSIQVEQTWLLLQFGNSNAEEIGTDRVEALVSASPEDEDGKTREEVVKTEIEDNDNNNHALHSLLHLWIGSAPLRRGTGLGSAVDKLRHQDLLCLGFAGVHQAHPLHGIAGFQFLGGSRFLRQLEHHLFQSALGGLVDLDEVRVQLLAQQHLVVEDGTVFFQVGFPHPAVLAQGFLWLLAQLQVGNLIVSVLDVGHGIVHLACSFLGWLRALHFGR